MQAAKTQGRKWILSGAAMMAIGIGALTWQDDARADLSGTNAAPVEAKLATIDVFRCLQIYMQRPEMVADRDAQNAELAATELEIRTRIQNNQAKLRILAQGDPQFATTQQAIQADSQAYQDFRQQAAVNAQTLAVVQSTEAFLAVQEKSSAIAAQLGYSHLIGAKLDHSDLITEDGPTSLNTSQMIQELLARPVLLAPAGDDITEQVLVEMDILQYEIADEDLAAPDGVQPPTPEPGDGG